MAEDLRTFLDVDEGLRCMIYGKPEEIPEEKANLYLAYAQIDKKGKKEGVSAEDEKALKDEEITDEAFFNIEHIVAEYSTIKTVLLNNSFPVDIEELQRGRN